MDQIAALEGNRRNCVFETPFGGLGTTYNVHLGLIGKRVGDFLSMLIELILLGVTAESLRAKRDGTRCSAIAERPRCRVRYSFRQK